MLRGYDTKLILLDSNRSGIKPRALQKGIDDLEIATAEYIDWFDHPRLHGEIGLIPPAEHETSHYRHNHASTTVEASVPSLH